MKKKEFIKIIKELLRIRKHEADLNKAFKKFEPDFNNISFFRYEALIADTLKYAFDDKHDWISYWIYDLDCGKNSMANSVTLHGKNVPMKTISDLYNVLMNKEM